MHYQGRKMWHTNDGSFTPGEWRERQLAALRESARGDHEATVVIEPDEQAEAYSEALRELRALSVRWRRRAALAKRQKRAEADEALAKMLVTTLRGMPMVRLREAPFPLCRVKRLPSPPPTIEALPVPGVRTSLGQWLRSRRSV